MLFRDIFHELTHCPSAACFVWDLCFALALTALGLWLAYEIWRRPFRRDPWEPERTGHGEAALAMAAVAGPAMLNAGAGMEPRPPEVLNRDADSGNGRRVKVKLTSTKKTAGPKRAEAAAVPPAGPEDGPEEPKSAIAAPTLAETQDADGEAEKDAKAEPGPEESSSEPAVVPGSRKRGDDLDEETKDAATRAAEMLMHWRE